MTEKNRKKETKMPNKIKTLQKFINSKKLKYIKEAYTLDTNIFFNIIALIFTKYIQYFK